MSAITDGLGRVVEQYRYDAFGTPEIRGAPLSSNPNGTLQVDGTLVNNRFLFTGREWAAPYGFYEYRNRAYHPGLGRFMSEDPMGLQAAGGKPSAAGMPQIAPGQVPAAFAATEGNLYRYCHNDPVNHSDPTGLYVTYSDGWSAKDAENFKEQFSKAWADPAGRAALEAKYADTKEHQFSPDRKSGAPENGATKFNDTHHSPTFGERIGAGLKGAKEALMGAAAQGSGNFEKGRQGDNSAANQSAKSVADEVGLSPGQSEMFHREISKQGYNRGEMLEEARRIQSTYPNK